MSRSSRRPARKLPGLEAEALRGYLDPKVVEAMNRIVGAGFDYVQFGQYHFRVEHMADFWPSTGKWKDFKHDVEGAGTLALIEHLRKFIDV